MSVIIKATDMSEEMQIYALDCLTRAMERYNIEKDIAAYIKKEFDKKYYPSWHCVVGRNFGSYVTHVTRHFIYFSKGQLYILLFKSAIDQECSLQKLALSTALPIVNSLILLFTIFVVKWTIKGS